jgi:hypothetical protein
MLGAILAVGGALLGAAGKVSQHKADKKAARANRASALASMGDQLAALSDRETQERIAAAQQAFALMDQGAAARGTLAVGAAENNVAGATVDALNTEVLTQEWQSQRTLDQNLTNVMLEISRTRDAVGQQAADRIASVAPPSGLGTALGVGASLLGGAAQLGGMRPPSSKLPKTGLPSIPNVTLPDLSHLKIP